MAQEGKASQLPRKTPPKRSEKRSTVDQNNVSRDAAYRTSPVYRYEAIKQVLAGPKQ